MRRPILILAAAGLAFAACSPQTFTMNVDMRYPSKSGLDLSRKTMSIVYMDDGSADTTFSNRVASSFARTLESEYFRGNEAVGVYKVPSDSVTLSLMHNLVMDTGDDVIFLLDTPSFGEVSLSDNTAVTNPPSVDSAFVAMAHTPFDVDMYVYDSMGKSDSIQRFTGKSTLRTRVYSNGVTAKEYLLRQAEKANSERGELVGTQIAGRFTPTWKTEGYSLYYYDDLKGEWVQAIYNAYDYRWKSASDIWMKQIASGNSLKRACACYNLAVAFYMMGDLNLATKWLDRADGYENLSLSPGLRKRIEARK